MAEELLHRHLLPPREGVARRDNQRHPVTGEVAELQMRVVGLATHEPEADRAALHLSHHGHAVADRGVDADVRVLPAEA